MDSIGSGLSDGTEPKQKQAAQRMLSHIETENDRLKKELEDEGAQKSNFGRIAAECRQEWGSIVLALIGAGGKGLIMPAFSYFFSEIFNVYSKTGDEMLDGARFWSIMFVVLGVLNMILDSTSMFFIGFAGETITMRLRMSVFRNVLSQDIGYFDSPKHSTGKICTRLATDVPNVKSALDYRFASVLSAFISMIAGSALAFYFGWQMALLVLGLFPMLAVGSYLRMRIRTNSAKRDNELLEEAGKVATEGIENARTVQSLTREQTFYDNFCSHLNMPYREGIKQAHIQAICFGFAQSLFMFMYAISFKFGAFLVENDKMDPLDVYRVFFAINFSGMMVGMATAYFPEYMKARFSAGLVFKMMNEKSKIDGFSKAGLQPDLTGALQFTDVHFTYPARVEAPVLQGLNIDLKPGQTLALVGPSGCGKSTVVSLLERFYDPLSGAVKADDLDLRTINVPYLRAHMALVSQEPVLFDCSIDQNISYGIKDITHDQVVEAAKRANIHNFINELPEGYETSVGEKGVQLSGGQKQRVAIARALVREPKILLLDEATSALDTESEKVVQEALDRAREGRTCIIIAHRLSTIQNADSIAVIKNGRVVEQGTHSELVAKRGDYYYLTKKQHLTV